MSHTGRNLMLDGFNSFEANDALFEPWIYSNIAANNQTNQVKAASEFEW